MLPDFELFLNLLLAFCTTVWLFPSSRSSEGNRLSISFFGRYLFIFTVVSLAQSIIILLLAHILKLSVHISILTSLLTTYIFGLSIGISRGSLSDFTEGLRVNYLSLITVCITFLLVHHTSAAIIHTDGLSMLSLSRDGPSVLWRMAYLDTMWGPVNTLLAYLYNLNYFKVITAWSYSFLLIIFINNITARPKLHEYLFWGVLFASKYYVHHLLLTHNSVICGILLFYSAWFYHKEKSNIFYIFLLLLGFFRMDTVVFLFLSMSILALMQLNSNKQKIHIVCLTIATAVCLLNYVVIDEVYYDALSKEKSLGLALISMAVLTVHLILFKNNYLFTRLLARGKRMQIVFLLIPVTGLVLFYRPDSLYNTMINLFSIRSRWSMIWWYIFIYACWKLYRVVKIKDINLVRDKFLSVFSGGNLFWLLYIFHIFFMTLLRSSYRVGFGDSGKRMFVIALFGFFAVFFTFKDGKKTELNHFSKQYN